MQKCGQGLENYSRPGIMSLLTECLKGSPSVWDRGTVSGDDAHCIIQNTINEASVFVTPDCQHSTSQLCTL